MRYRQSEIVVPSDPACIYFNAADGTSTRTNETFGPDDVRAGRQGIYDPVKVQQRWPGPRQLWRDTFLLLCVKRFLRSCANRSEMISHFSEGSLNIVIIR